MARDRCTVAQLPSGCSSQILVFMIIWVQYIWYLIPCFWKAKISMDVFSKEWLNFPTCKEKCRDDFPFKSLAYFTNFSRLKRFDRLGDEKNISSPKNQAYSKVSDISRALSRMRSLVFSLPFAFLVVIGISSAQKIKVFLILNCFSSSTPISLRDRVNHSPFVIIIVRWSRNHYYHRKVI